MNATATPNAQDAAPAWIAAQTRQLLARPGHAWLLQGPSGLGQYRLALDLARAWLCDHPGPQGACGQCASCHAIDVRAHTDLCVLMPETIMQALEWPLSEKAQLELDQKKRKPSREIRVEAMRDAVEFAQRTSGRGRGKVVLVYPAERMNHVTANALLKTLEEPPGDLRFVLASESAQQLLPTIRSRCLTHTMAWPNEADALQWLGGQGVAAPEAASLLRISGGRPEDALQLHLGGTPAARWQALPRALAAGQADALDGWPAAQALDALQRLCHDLMARACGAAPRYFAAADLPARPVSLAALAAWSRELGASARTIEHPFVAGLLAEHLVVRARRVLNSGS